MINEVEILKELDEQIKIQAISVESSYVGDGAENVAYKTGRLDELREIRDFIKEKSAHGAATPMSTLLNKQEQYNTDQEKIEPVKLAQEIFALCMKIQEGEDGRVEHRNRCRSSEPAVFVDFYGHVAQLDVSISPIGWTEDDSARERFSFYMGDYWDQQEEERAIRCKKRLIELLEERRGNDNEE